MSDDERPIIIKKIKKSGEHGHHGGAWKIAYADFVTAMMAFFLLMWLLNATTQEQRRGIANYFDPMTIAEHKGGGDGVMGGQSVSSDQGASKNATSTITIQESKPVEKGEGGRTVQTKIQETDDDAIINEEKNFQSVKEELQKAVENNPEMKEWLKNLMIDETPEGLRIQIIDQQDKSMFPSGSSEMYDHTKKLLQQVSMIIQKVPNKISISGHTDAAPYNAKNYTNWELSSDRANACRRVLEDQGVPDHRFSSVVGRESRDLFVKDDPFAPQNRRISIMLLRQHPQKANAPAQDPAPADAAAGAPSPAPVASPTTGG